MGWPSAGGWCLQRPRGHGPRRRSATPNHAHMRPSRRHGATCQPHAWRRPRPLKRLWARARPRGPRTRWRPPACWHRHARRVQVVRRPPRQARPSRGQSTGLLGLMTSRWGPARQATPALWEGPRWTHTSDAMPTSCRPTKVKPRPRGGLRFRKDPRFLASSWLVKKPSRLQGLLLVMTLAWLVYAVAQRRRRHYLARHHATVPHPINQPPRRPP